MLLSFMYLYNVLQTVLVLMVATVTTEVITTTFRIEDLREIILWREVHVTPWMQNLQASTTMQSGDSYYILRKNYNVHTHVVCGNEIVVCSFLLTNNELNAEYA